MALKRLYISYYLIQVLILLDVIATKDVRMVNYYSNRSDYCVLKKKKMN